MDFLGWVAFHWIDLAQTAGIIAAIFLTRSTLLRDVRVRSVANSIQLTQHHRALWERMLSDPQLQRILDSRADLDEAPPTPAEEMFAIFIILHICDTYFATQAGFFQRPEGLKKDIRQLFSLPIPSAIWHRVKDLQEAEFARFVDECLEEEYDLETETA